MNFINSLVGNGPPPDHEIAVKALTYLYPGANPSFTYHNISSPVKPNQLLVRVTHASLNPVDVKTMKTNLTWAVPGEKGIGRDFSGVIDEVGSGLSGSWKVGDRVCGLKQQLVGKGTLASHVIITPGTDAVIVTPDSLTDEEAAAFPLVFGTAFQALSRAKLDKSSWVCVLGGTTATGMYVIQLAKKFFNVERVVVTSGSEDLARSLGADEIVNYKAISTSISDALLQTGQPNPKKFQIIVDCVGGVEVLNRHKELLEPKSNGSAYVTLVGDSESDFHGLGGPVAYTYNPAMVGRKLFSGVSGINYHVEVVFPGDWINNAAELFKRGVIKVVIDQTMDWRQYEEAMDKVTNSNLKGKVVLKIEDF